MQVLAFPRTLVVPLALALVSLSSGGSSAQQADGAESLTVLRSSGTDTIPTLTVDGRRMVALADLARAFDLAVTDDELAGAVTISSGDRTIVLAPTQGLASVDGRLVSLPAPPQRRDDTWIVPVEFVSRALALVYAERLDYRGAAGLIVVGDLTVPKVVVRSQQASGRVTLTFGITPRVTQRIDQEPGALRVRFDADALDPDIAAPPDRELVSAVTADAAASEIMIALGPAFASFRATEEPAGSDGTRLVVEILGAGAATDATPSGGVAPSPELPAPGGTPTLVPPPAGPPPALALSDATFRTVVIDPGHGGDEEGAVGPGGTLEKTVTMAVARRLKAAIERRLGLQVLLTRDGDQTVSLDERAAMANNNKADLFISLHANASVSPLASGAEVYFLSLDDYGQQAQDVARASGELLPVVGGGSREIQMILWEMAQARHISDSSRLADIVETALRDRVPMHRAAIQQAPFRVLAGANMPAVLVEMAFISNAAEERRLGSADFQNEVASALLESVIRFRDYSEAGGRRVASVAGGADVAGGPAPPAESREP